MCLNISCSLNLPFLYREGVLIFYSLLNMLQNIRIGNKKVRIASFWIHQYLFSLNFTIFYSEEVPIFIHFPICFKIFVPGTKRCVSPHFGCLNISFSLNFPVLYREEVPIFYIHLNMLQNIRIGNILVCIDSIWLPQYLV